VANIRKHQLLKPELKVLMTAVDSITPSNYVFEYLDVEALDMQQMNLQLGFPGNIVHVIRPNSPLYNLSLQVSQKVLLLATAGEASSRAFCGFGGRIIFQSPQHCPYRQRLVGMPALR
jgi:hypothetical protein